MRYEGILIATIGTTAVAKSANLSLSNEWNDVGKGTKNYLLQVAVTLTKEEYDRLVKAALKDKGQL